MQISERLRAALNEAGRGGATAAELARAAELERRQADEQLLALEQEGDSVEDSGRWYSPARSDWWTGTVLRLQRGDALLLAERGGEATMFIPRRHLHGARDGDLVAVKTARRHRGQGGRRADDRLPEGRVAKVLRRAYQRLVCIVDSPGPWTQVTPLDPRINMEIWVHRGHGRDHHLEPGRVVQVDLTEKAHRGGVVATLVQNLGSIDDPATDTPAVIAQFELPDRFSSQTMEYAESLPEDPAEADWQGRSDLRELPTLTIDGADAKDFDDAISIEKRKDGFRLWVHIADVAHYVGEESAIDRDAVERGTSVYFADRVVPMLPEQLSNGLCSLRPGVPRLAMTARLDFDANGEMSARKVFPSVIESDLRATYSQVERFLAGEKVDGLSKTPLAKVVRTADELLSLRLAVRRARGALDLEIPASRVAVDAAGHPTAIVDTDRLRAHRLIEESMLAANEAVATELEMQEVVSVHRVHPSPDPAAAEELAQALTALGLEGPRDYEALHPEGLQQLVETATERGLETVVSRLILRSLQRAHYSVESAGHFALALRHYTHFTSPIRRYPDLLVHRSLKAHWDGTDQGASASHYQELAAHSSETERRAEKAERELTLVKKLRWLSGSEGTKCPATVVGVGRIGLFVELDEVLVDGLVPRENLNDDRYQLEADRYRWVGERHGRNFTIGDAVEVEIRSIDIVSRRLDLALTSMRDETRTDRHPHHGGKPAFGKGRGR